MQYIVSKIKRVSLIGADIAIFYLALFLALFLRDVDRRLWSEHLAPFTIILILWISLYSLYDLYDPRSARTDLSFLAKLLYATLINLAIGAAFFYVLSGRFIRIRPQGVLLYHATIFFFFDLVWRQFYHRILRSSPFRTNLVIVGATPPAIEIARVIERQPESGYRVCAILNPEGKRDIPRNMEAMVMDFPKDFLSFLNERRVSAIVSGVDYRTQPEVVKRLSDSVWLGVKFYDLPSFYEEITGKVPVTTIQQVWFLENLTEGEKSLYSIVKRLADIFCSILFGLLALPLMPFIAFAVKRSSSGPIFFRQVRIGKHGRPFHAIKFRTMVTGAEWHGPQWTQSNDPRVTRIGRALRKVRLDEIPQLWNVFRGDMTFVGPRPEQPELVKSLLHSIPFYRERLLVKPGLTGWAQIHAPLTSASYEDSFEKFRYDLYYIKHRSIILDLGIMLKTIDIILGGKGR